MDKAAVNWRERSPAAVGTMNPLPNVTHTPPVTEARPDDLKLSRKEHILWLNGLRGVLSLLVYIRHFAMPFQEELDCGYGTHDRFGILRLPPLRLVYAPPAVPMFFVISGFLISLQLFRALGRKNRVNFVASVKRILLYRSIRLALLPVLVTFVVAIAAHCGLLSQHEFVGRCLDQPHVFATFREQLWDWLLGVVCMLDPFSWQPRPLPYGLHFWTVGVQLQCGMGLVLFLLTFAEFQSHARLGAAVALFAICVACGRMDFALHLAGAGGAVVYLHQHDLPAWLLAGAGKPTKTIQSSIHSCRSSWKARLIFTLWTINLVCAMYLGSFPRFNDGSPMPGYHWLRLVSRFPFNWHGMAGIQFLVALSTSARARSIFEGRRVRCLGRLSFYIYVIHIVFIQSIGLRTVKMTWLIIGHESPWQYQLGFISGVILTAVLVLPCAELLQRFDVLVNDRAVQILDSLTRQPRKPFLQS